MIVRTFFRQREDGTNLYRTYSDKNMMIRQIETNTLYDEAVDVENAPYSYEETAIAIDENRKEITEEEGDEMLAKFNEEQEKTINNEQSR